MPPAETAGLELIQFRCLKLYSFNQTVDKYGSELSTLAAIFVYGLKIPAKCRNFFAKLI